MTSKGTDFGQFYREFEDKVEKPFGRFVAQVFSKNIPLVYVFTTENVGQHLKFGKLDLFQLWRQQ